MSIIQQGGDGTLLSSITDIGDITPANAVADNYSYQLFEATLSGSADDQGDISAVNTFGFASTFEVVFQDSSTDTRGFNTSGANVFAALPSDAVDDYQNNSFPNAGMLASGPATGNNASPWPVQDWQAYVTALKNDAAALQDIRIVAGFTGGTAQQASPMLSQYGVQYVANDKYGTDYFWLVPDTSNGATNTDWIRIPASQLMQNIYVQPGPLEVHVGGKDGAIVYQTSFTPNDADGQVSRIFRRRIRCRILGRQRHFAQSAGHDEHRFQQDLELDGQLRLQRRARSECGHLHQHARHRPGYYRRQ